MSLQIPARTRELVYRRDGSCCARCTRSILNFPSSIHHRKPRQMGGTTDPRINDPRNLIRVCGTGITGCHGWIESNRAEALVDGWLVRSLDDADLDKPLRSVWGELITLSGIGLRSDDWPTQEVPV